MYTAACCRHLAAKGYPITLVTPGNSLDEILRVVPELGPDVDQVVLLGYPPFLKNVVDVGIARGVDWSRLHIKLVAAGEVFSEPWRDLVGRRAGLGQPCLDSASLYGTADAGVLGTEIRTQLRRLNSEFADYVPDDHQTRGVELRPAGDPEYFPAGVKHRYTRASRSGGGRIGLA
jgi:phenylacetate-coenzyme A ligase PaaK-like adenylate-forming protein